MSESDQTLVTSTGTLFSLLDPNPDDVHIEDIAQALSKLCRFNGHCKEFYSVAQHSIHCSTFSESDKLAALLHDATEAYVGDMIRPVKHALRSSMPSAYDLIESRVWQAIALRFELPMELPRAVKDADNRMLATELKLFMPLPAGFERWPTDVEPYSVVLRPMSPDRAYLEFLERYGELTGDRQPLYLAWSARESERAQ